MTHRTNAAGGSKGINFKAVLSHFSSLSAAFCLELLYFVPCRQVGVSSYCCSAVSRSLIARPPPFLGVSSLNLAALRSGHFFCADLLGRGGVAASLVDVKSTSLAAPGHVPKSLAQKSPENLGSAKLTIRRLRGADRGARDGRGGSPSRCASPASGACGPIRKLLSWRSCLHPDTARD